MFGPRIAGAAAFFQTLRQIAAACFKRWPQTKQDSGENGHREGECKDDAVHIYFVKPRKTVRPQPFQEFHAGRSNKNSSHATNQRKHQTFRQQLADQPGSSGSEGGADRDFALTNGIAREKQAGDIGASNQEN